MRGPNISSTLAEGDVAGIPPDARLLAFLLLATHIAHARPLAESIDVSGETRARAPDTT